MVRGLLIGALILVATPAFPQSAPAPDPDGPRSTGPRPDSIPPQAPASKPLVPPSVGSKDGPPAPTPAEAAVEEGPHGRQQLFISPAGEPFRVDFGQPYPVEAWFKRADANGDGSLSLAEFKADAARFFKVLDANHDGVIDGFENDDYENKMVPEILPRVGGLTARDVMTRKELLEGKAGRGGGARRGGGGGGFMGGGRRGAGQFGLLDEPQPVRGADKDLNYRITPEEWDLAAAHRFATLDKNHDGKLEFSELPPTPLQLMIAEREKREAKHKK